MRGFRHLLIIGLVAAVAACGEATWPNDGAPPADAAGGPFVTAPAEAHRTRGAEPAKTPRPGKSADGQVVIVRQLAIAWQTQFGMVDVIVELRNEGPRVAQINTGRYTMFSKSGGELDKGIFMYAFPRMLGPGETGYIAERDWSEVWRAADVGTIEATFSYDWLDGSKEVGLTTANISHEKDPYGSGGYISGGTVTNHYEDFLPMVHVGVFYLAADGAPLGFTYTDLVENLAPGQTKPFKTYGESPPLESWDRTLVIAVAD